VVHPIDSRVFLMTALTLTNIVYVYNWRLFIVNACNKIGRPSSKTRTYLITATCRTEKYVTHTYCNKQNVTDKLIQVMISAKC
jgi:hypothetical protein